MQDVIGAAFRTQVQQLRNRARHIQIITKTPSREGQAVGQQRVERTAFEGGEILVAIACGDQRCTMVAVPVEAEAADGRIQCVGHHAHAPERQSLIPQRLAETVEQGDAIILRRRLFGDPANDLSHARLLPAMSSNNHLMIQGSLGPHGERRQRTDKKRHHRNCATSASAPLSIPASAAASAPTLALISYGLGYCLETKAPSKREVDASNISTAYTTEPVSDPSPSRTVCTPL